MLIIAEKQPPHYGIYTKKSIRILFRRWKYIYWILIFSCYRLCNVDRVFSNVLPLLLLLLFFRHFLFLSGQYVWRQSIDWLIAKRKGAYNNQPENNVNIEDIRRCFSLIGSLFKFFSLSRLFFLSSFSGYLVHILCILPSMSQRCLVLWFPFLCCDCVHCCYSLSPFQSAWLT